MSILAPSPSPVIDLPASGIAVGGLEMLHDGTSHGRLCLHTGGRIVTPEELSQVPTPEPSGRHYPIAHSAFLDVVIRGLGQYGFAVRDQAHAVSRESNMYFGLLALFNPKTDAPYEYVLGLRNSHDKSVACRLAMGTRVFVCDNRAFSGEINLARKHTRNVHTDMPRLVGSVLGALGELHMAYDNRVEAYREHRLSNAEAAEMFFGLLTQAVFSGQHAPAVWNAWHASESERNVWGAFNAVTSVLREIRDPGALISRTRRLHALCDGVSGVLAHRLERDDAVVLDA